MGRTLWDYEGERVLVTGGATGIGRAIGLEFVQAGAQVVLLGRKREALDEAVKLIGDAGPGHATSVVCDVMEPSEITSAAREVTERLGGIDILVNNAGVGGSTPFLEVTDAEIDLNLDVNLKATILVTRAFLNGMLARGRGVVINISSQAGKRGFPQIAHYSASKAGVLGFTFSLAAEVAPMVRVNAVCPGMVMTGMMGDNILRSSQQKAISYDDAYAEWSSGIPMGRMQQPSDVANGVLFLASDAAREITGEALNISGGQTTH